MKKVLCIIMSLRFIDGRKKNVQKKEECEHSEERKLQQENHSADRICMLNAGMCQNEMGKGN